MDDKEKIEKIMQIEKMNSVQFAAEIGIQGSTLSHILNGRNKPSLEVLKKILNRFRTINSDWLILDTGTMYRHEKHSQTPTLFPFDDETNTNTVISEQKADQKLQSVFTQKRNEVASVDIRAALIPELPTSNELKSESVNKLVNKIIVYYSDNTFQEFIGH
ncbi:MAG: helix-turn-helix transcriptional regulator [Paludibacter sp.]|nr:helix-turn-helix transcriptional regulator [Paludibacter sp.]